VVQRRRDLNAGDVIHRQDERQDTARTSPELLVHARHRNGEPFRLSEKVPELLDVGPRKDTLRQLHDEQRVVPTDGRDQRPREEIADTGHVVEGIDGRHDVASLRSAYSCNLCDVAISPPVVSSGKKARRAAITAASRATKLHSLLALAHSSRSTEG